MQVEAVARDSAIVVYFRLSQLGAAEFANDRIAYAVRQLREIVAAELLAFTAKNSGAHPPESRSSVYGRFVILPGRSAEAVDFACAVMARARDQKVALTIGIAQGAILPTVDAMGGNVAGVPINYAARLAFLKLGVSFIAVEDGLALRASRARSQPAWSFIPSIGQDPTTEKVKQTTVSFRRIAGIDENPPVAANLAPVDGDFTSETACVIAVDIERYSENNLNDMVSKAFELLGQGVSHANQSAGGSLAAIGRCYAPGGDGGVFVYREGVGGGVRSAWTFATSLWNHCGSRVPVRIGVTLEDVVIVDEEYPVGTGVLEADMLSSHARLDAICCSQSFWTHDFVKKETEGWYQLEIQTKNGLTAFLVSNKKQPEKEASVNESHVDTAYRKKIEESLQRFQESADIRQIYERVHGHPPTGNDSQQWNAETAAKLAKPAGFDIDGPMGSLILLRDEWIDAGKDDASKLLHRVIDFCLPVRFHRDTIRSIMHQIESGQRVIVATGTRRGTQVAMAYLTTYLTQNKVVGRPRLAEPRDSETSFERVLDCPVFSDPRRTLVEIIHGIACQVNLETSTPLPKQDDSPDLNNYCKELNIKIRWSSRRNQLVFFVFVSNVAVHFGNKSRDEIIERLRCLLPDLFFVDLNCSTASLIDEADLGGI